MELVMNRKLLLSLAGAAAGACMLYGTAQAAPASSTLDALKTLGTEHSTVEKARCWRRCWRTRYGWRCRRWCRHRRW
jgi:hypothetical protein